MRRARLAIGVGLVGLLGVVGAGLVAPRRVAAAVASAERALVAGLDGVPEPVLLVGALLLAVVLWFVAVRYLLVLCYRVWRRLSKRLYWALTLVLPESPLVQFAAGAMVLIGLFILIVGGLPALIGDLSESDEGAAGYVNQIGADALNAEWTNIVDGDAVGGEPGCDGAGAPGDGAAADRDGDGLPDAWERAGETPDGAALPDADPDRKDLYVQVNYGEDIAPLSADERDQLRAVWAEMPVENPDGTTGVALHLDNASEGAGDLGEPAEITALEERNAWYTADRLGPRRCVYRQVVYGKVDAGDAAGVASTPGYAAFVDGARQPDYEGDVSFRVALTTHELLHTAVGRVDGRPHTSEGWLAGGPDNEYLSPATADDVGASGLYGPAS